MRLERADKNKNPTKDVGNKNPTKDVGKNRQADNQTAQGRRTAQEAKTGGQDQTGQDQRKLRTCRRRYKRLSARCWSSFRLLHAWQSSHPLTIVIEAVPGSYSMSKSGLRPSRCSCTHLSVAFLMGLGMRRACAHRLTTSTPLLYAKFWLLLATGKSVLHQHGRSGKCCLAQRQRQSPHSHPGWPCAESGGL